ncbi:hypothetical protein PF008_g32607 [Phytophthora fragariae]|uniref:Uncharacterized protein n=1 Tax=Phytophthora fragariae TaxID=53985 RepID=A0A6G0PZC5_9STRA|nr:hypothetical protein PF008_g32607 [Phytophthora fragariae]
MILLVKMIILCGRCKTSSVIVLCPSHLSVQICTYRATVRHFAVFALQHVSSTVQYVQLSLDTKGPLEIRGGRVTFTLQCCTCTIDLCQHHKIKKSLNSVVIPP